MRRAVALCLVLGGLGGCASGRGGTGEDGGPSVARDPGGLVPVFAHVRVDADRGIVEFDGFVPIDCHDARTPDVWLEQIVCLVDTKEHESLVVSRARASEIHAALLLAGFEAGAPGSWRWDGVRIVPTLPTGDAIEVLFVMHDALGNERVGRATDWVIDATRTRTLREHLGKGAPFVFAGSRFVNYNGPEVYDADLAGTVIGLATFGGETIALREVISPEETYQEAEWLANAERVPAYGTEVIVRIVRPDE